MFNHVSTNPTKWSNTLKQFIGKLATNWMSVFDHFAGLALKGLTKLASTPNNCLKSVRIRSFCNPYSVRMQENTNQKKSKYGDTF